MGDKMNKENLKIEQPESFFATVRKGDSQGLLEITIPKTYAIALGIVEGTNLKVWIKQINKE